MNDFIPLKNWFNKLFTWVGTLTNLQTTAKSDLVSAVNEVNGQLKYKSSSGDVLALAQTLSVGERKYYYFTMSATNKPTNNEGLAVLSRTDDSQNNILRVDYFDINTGYHWQNVRYGGSWSGWSSLNEQIADSGWLTVAINSAYATGSIQYRKVGKVATVIVPNIIYSNMTANDDNDIAQIPIGFRPSYANIIRNYANGYLFIRNDGLIKLHPTAQSAYMSASFTYIVA